VHACMRVYTCMYVYMCLVYMFIPPCSVTKMSNRNNIVYIYIYFYKLIKHEIKYFLQL